MLARAERVKEVEGGFLYFLPCQNHKDFVRNTATQAVMELRDPRQITREQQKKAYVLIGWIAKWWGYLPQDATKEILKEMFMGYQDTTLQETFSLGDCSVEEARLFISYLIDFCLLHGVDTGVPLNEMAEDIDRYVWACTMNHVCACCGKKAEIHHWTAVGMGRNRKEIVHLGMKVIPLCREHHTEAHTIGKEEFLKKYILTTVEVDEQIAESWNLNRKKRTRRKKEQKK
ncbi:putative phage protein [Selenomonas ruminantium subsp. lactilytica TAM6421]|uniref:Putative phage protein n=1 Tax=Selenomonas ruminantium subsp. lactilytica (strain NBRC 103574 / TAM6421) TaxID=927704 RepID=I0GS17_SELRL|nr:putative HNHc nuclease [Selenomonas ruminantium]BAL83554.1 putative phage protein [Selenomonas ruminantium subsp. lactilytica TAM6421]